MLDFMPFHLANKEFHSFQRRWICPIICRFISRSPVIIREGIYLGNLWYNILALDNKIKGILKIHASFTWITNDDTNPEEKVSGVKIVEKAVGFFNGKTLVHAFQGVI